MANETTIGVRELKNNLSRYLRRAQSGETMIVKARGKTIAKLSPPDEEREDLRQRLLAAVEQGIADWNGERLKPKKPTIVNRSGRMVSDLLLEDRG